MSASANVPDIVNDIVNDSPVQSSSQESAALSVQDLWASNSAIDAITLADGYVDSEYGHVASWIEQQVQTICRGELDYSKLESPLVEYANERAFETLSTFCEGWDEGLASFSLPELRSRSARAEYQKAQVQKAILTTDSKGVLLGELIFKSETPQEITNLISVLRENTSIGRALAFENRVSFEMNPREYQLAVGIASGLISCSQFSGCAPGGIVVQQHCMMLGSICHPGISYEELLYEGISPRDLRNAVSLIEWMSSPDPYL